MAIVSRRLPSSGNNIAPPKLRSEHGFTLVRVTSVILDDTHPAWETLGGWDSLGTIFYVDPNTTYSSFVSGLEYEILPHARPLNANQRNYPLIGELVLLLSNLVSKNVLNPVANKNQEGIAYYMSSVNIWNHPHHNALPQNFKVDELEGAPTIKGFEQTENGIILRKKTESDLDVPLGNNFIEKINIKPLLPYEGDMILEGRFGNSIRFGATTAYDDANPNNKQNLWSNNSAGGKSTINPNKEGVVGDPIVIIRNGQDSDLEEGWIPTLEDINKDDSSIYMTSNQVLSTLKVATSTKGSPDKTKQNSYYQNVDENGNVVQDEFEIKSDIDSNSALVFLPTTSPMIGPQPQNEDDSYVAEPLSQFESTELLEVSESIYEEEGLSFYDELKKTGMTDDDFESYEASFGNTFVSGEYEGTTDEGGEGNAGEYSSDSSVEGAATGWLYLKYLEELGGGPYPGGGKKLIFQFLGFYGEKHRLKGFDRVRNQSWYQSAVGFFWGEEDEEKLKAELDAKQNPTDYANHFILPGIKGSITRVMRPKPWSSFKNNYDTYISHKGRRGGTEPIGVQRKGFGPVASNKTLLCIHVTAGSRGRSMMDVSYGHIVPDTSATKNDRVGYHMIILEDGQITKFYDDKEHAYGVISRAGGKSKGRDVPHVDGIEKGVLYNDVMISINLVGSNKWTKNYVPTRAQQWTLNKIVKHYMNDRYPSMKVCGHNQVIPIGQGKSCPGFDVRAYAKELGLQPNQIVQQEPKCFDRKDGSARKYKVENLEVYRERGIAIAQEKGEDFLATLTRKDSTTST